MIISYFYLSGNPNQSGLQREVYHGIFVFVTIKDKMDDSDHNDEDNKTITFVHVFNNTAQDANTLDNNHILRLNMKKRIHPI